MLRQVRQWLLQQSIVVVERMFAPLELLWTIGQMQPYPQIASRLHL